MATTPEEVKIFSGTASEYLAKNIAKSYGLPLGNVKVSRFSDGEFSVSYEETVRGAHVFIVQSTFPPTDNLFEVLLMIDAAKRASAKKITVVTPYFGFARQDRKDNPRVAIGSKMVANLITAAGATRIMTMDLHADQIQGFFEMPVDHLYASTIFLPYLKSIATPNMIMAAPDTGGTKRANAYAKYLNTDLAICYKQRKKANIIDSMELIGNVEGKNVVLVDDMVDTAGTLTKASDLMIQRGASSVRAVCTHGILSGDAYKKIEKSSLAELIITDTIPVETKSRKVKILSCAQLFASTMKNVHLNKSIDKNFLN